MTLKTRFVLIHRILLARYAPVGGQAVIEGVMMRSPRMVSTAVRRADGEIVRQTRPFHSITQRVKLLSIPLIRGVVGMVETLGLGMKCLTFSADEAAKEEAIKEGKKPDQAKGMSNWSMTVTLVLSFGLGLLVFFYLPLKLTELTGVSGSLWFNIVDGLFRMIFFLGYMVLISQWKEMRRLFQYHGAEHKVIHTFEADLEVTPENAKPFTTLHPRCGTSFLFSIMLISVVVFVFFGKPDTVGERLLRLAGMPLIAGLGFEFIRFSGKHAEKTWVRIASTPGLWLQRITTKEPDMEQLAVACDALNSVLPLTEEDKKDVRVM